MAAWEVCHPVFERTNGAANKNASPTWLSSAWRQTNKPSSMDLIAGQGCIARLSFRARTACRGCWISLTTGLALTRCRCRCRARATGFITGLITTGGAGGDGGGGGGGGAAAAAAAAGSDCPSSGTTWKTVRLRISPGKSKLGSDESTLNETSKYFRVTPLVVLMTEPYLRRSLPSGDTVEPFLPSLFCHRST